jgi:hypothetical protein
MRTLKYTHTFSDETTITAFIRPMKPTPLAFYGKTNMLQCALSESMAFIRTCIIRCTESFTTERFGLSDLVELCLLSLDWRRPSVLRACTQKETKEDLRTGEVVRYHAAKLCSLGGMVPR